MEPRYRILMADDVTRYHALYERAITDAIQASVHFAVNGEDALAKLSGAQPYDLLILDLNMPKVSGEEALKRLRLDPTHDMMPVIILTGDTDQETQRRLLDAGADDFVEKGASPEVFVARVKARLRHREALERLARLAVDMDIFAAGVLHDIRNLETNVLTVCELARAYLDEDPIGRRDQILEDLGALEDKADHLGRYAEGILKMVRDTTRTLALEPTDLTPVLEWATRMAAPPGALHSLRLTTLGTLAPVIADQSFLKLALLNVMGNAVKYRREGVTPSVTVSQRLGRQDIATPGGGPMIVTMIRDEGVGIKKDELRRVFEPFVRGSGWRKKEGGFGLGLSLVVKVMTSMGGRVWAEIPEDGGPGSVLCLELQAATAAGGTPPLGSGDRADA